jgi:putative phosphoserine phosphatase/1-acylglycerol-3-phosphate O-acyltransferase
MANAAAIFDLDHTLVPRAAWPVFERHLTGVGLEPTNLLPGERTVRRLLDLGGDNRVSMQLDRAGVRATKGWPVSTVHEAAEAAGLDLAGQVLPYGLQELEDQRAAGRITVLATPLPEQLVRPLAERIGFDDVVATRWAVDGDSYAGHVDGPYVWGRQKLAAVQEWAKRHDVALEDSYAFAHAFADAALLGAVGRPVAVDPDPRLAALAAARRWRVRWFDVPKGVVKVAGRELQEWLRPLAREDLVGNARIDLSGLENIPRQGPAIVVFNHRSYFDGTVVGMAVSKAGRSARGIGKKEVFDAPLIGPFMKAFGGVRVDRGTGSDEPVRAAARALRAGEVVMIAPEGTIPRGPAFFEPELKGRWGAARLAHETRAPVIPLGLWGTEHVWPRNQRLPRMVFPGPPPKVTAQIGPPVRLRYDDVDADTRRIMEAIVDQLPVEARVRRTPTEAELRRTYPANYRGDPARELSRRPGFDR